MIRLFGTLAALVLAGLLLAAPASADYEQASEHFGVSGEAEQLEESLGTAVNESGAGLPGAEAGSLYVVGSKRRVLRYALGKEGEEPSFREAWGWGVGSSAEGAPASGYQRCGPVLTTEPTQNTFHTCRPVPEFAGEGGEQTGDFEGLTGVAIDQTTGDVYVRNTTVTGIREHHLIEVFTATGEPVVNGSGEDGFGDAGRRSPPPAESSDEGPEKLHEGTAFVEAIAVDESGTVYLNDGDFSGVADQHARVMSFKPCNVGEYDNYCYTGQGHDIVSSSAQPFSKLSLTAAGGLVTANRELVREYALGQGSTPICSLPVTGTLTAMTANPDTGEVFYFTGSERSIHRLGPCNEATGKFEELQKAKKPAPETHEIFALAVNASIHWAPLRPPGVLYGVDYERHGAQKGIGDILVPAKVFPPLIESQSVANTTISSTTLKAQIDPRGSATEYSFQYLTQATYAAQLAAAEGEGKSGEEAEDAAFEGAAEAPPSPGQIPSGKVATAAAPISGLSPDTVYRFRVLATSHCNPEDPAQTCKAQSQAASFVTYPTSLAVPPDGRAYELVSPTQKNSGEVFPADPRVSSCVDNEGIPFNGPCKPPGSTIISVFPMQSAPGGDAVAYMGYPFSPTEGAAVFNSYISRRTESGWQTIAMSPALLATKGGEDLAFDRSLSTGTIVQRGTSMLAPEAPAGYPNVYLQHAASPAGLTPLLAFQPHRPTSSFALEYAGGSPDFTRQYFAANDVLTAATPYAPEPPDPTAGGSKPSGRDLYEWHGGTLALVNVLPGNAAVAEGASFASVSPDVHAVSASGRRVFFQAGGHVYVREDGQITRELAHPGSFLTASEGGLQVLFSDGCLYSLLTEACTDLTEGQSGFQGIVGHGEDLSHIYFLDTKVLPAGEENEYGEKPTNGVANLYSWQLGRLLYVATVSPATGEASPAGRFLAFSSTKSLTGYDNVGPCGKNFNISEGKYELFQFPCTEVYRYDSATGDLTCPSCNPTGEAPLGSSYLRQIDDAQAWQPQPRYLTDSGRLFFDSSDRLSPRDTNGHVEDVYEYEPDGLGSCTRAQGCVALISPGTGSVDSNFLAADSSGANVFFTSRERLVPTDTDELIDLYDARVGGGFASETETQRAECQGESCQPVAQAPNDPTPSSAAFNGAGNVKEGGAKPTRCPQGKVKQGGKCVKKKAHKKKRRRAAKRTYRANRDRRAHR